MIENLKCKNFKAFQSLEIEFSRLNILCGENGAGKSSIIQQLLLLRQSSPEILFSNDTDQRLFLGDERNPHHFIAIGTYEDVLYDGYKTGENFFEISLRFSKNEVGYWTEPYEVRIRTKPFDASNRSDIEVQTESERPKLVMAVAEALFLRKRFQFLSADRWGPKERLPSNNSRLEDKDFGKQGEYAMNYFMANRGKALPLPALCHPSESSNILEMQFNAWLGGISAGIQVKPEYLPYDKENIIAKYAYIKDGLEGKSFKAKNVGFGISYTFPIILALLTAQKGDLIIIENPEAHLHPAGQSVLAELMAVAANEGVQIIVETHSDHIINGVLVAAKRKKINPKEVFKIYYIGEGEEGAKAEEVVISEQGQIRRSPAGFFDQIDKDLKVLLAYG